LKTPTITDFISPAATAGLLFLGPGRIVPAMNSIDEVRYLDHLVNALSSGRMRLLEGDEDVTQRELGRLAGEVAAIESMLRQAQAGRDDR
jgi:hypothetical protein